MSKISIIVPVYNSQKYLRECLDSIVTQQYNHIEILIIYTESTDNTFQICQSYSAKDNRIRVIPKTDSIPGAAHARNIGLRHALGDYIGFVDSDDIISSDMYQVLVKNIKMHNADISIGKETRSLQDLQRKATQKKQISLTAPEAKKEFIAGNLFYGELWNKLFHRDILDGLAFDERLTVAEDLDFTWKAICRAQKIIYTSNTLYFYRTGTSGLTSSFCLKYIEDTFRVFRQIENDLHKKDDLYALLSYRKKVYLAQCYLAFEKNMSDPDLDLQNTLKQELKKYRRVQSGKSCFKRKERLLSEVTSFSPRIGSLIYNCYKKVKEL